MLWELTSLTSAPKQGSNNETEERGASMTQLTGAKLQRHFIIVPETPHCVITEGFIKGPKQFASFNQGDGGVLSHLHSETTEACLI